PRSAVRGNLLGAMRMLAAGLAALLHGDGVSFEWIAIGMAAGGGLGAILAVKVAMTSMPQLVALFNGTGGAASTLVAGAALWVSIRPGSTDVLDVQLTLSTGVSALVGSITALGSLVAVCELQEIIVPRNAVTSPIL